MTLSPGHQQGTPLLSSDLRFFNIISFRLFIRCNRLLKVLLFFPLCRCGNQASEGLCGRVQGWGFHHLGQAPNPVFLLIRTLYCLRDITVTPLPHRVDLDLRQKKQLPRVISCLHLNVKPCLGFVLLTGLFRLLFRRPIWKDRHLKMLIHTHLVSAFHTDVWNVRGAVSVIWTEATVTEAKTNFRPR